MKVTLIGCGCGAESLTAEARKAIADAQLLLGAGRLLEYFPEKERKAEAVTAEALAGALRAADCESACVLFSGDSGFYSGARLLAKALEGTDTELRQLPGISSLQVFAARLGLAWQDWKLCSAHGVDCDPVSCVCEGKPAFFLTGGRVSPAGLCRQLQEAGLGFLRAFTGENLGCEGERIRSGTAAGLAAETFLPLSVLLVEAAPRPAPRTSGIPDGDFLRAEHIPMTKQEVRAVALAKLCVHPGEVCWDIGAGTGSVSIELALQAGKVFAIERNPEALQLLRQNRERFGAWNLSLREGTAPDALQDLAAPDAVFAGGSGGRLKEILRAVHSANPAARICVSAVTVETLALAQETLRELEYNVQICQIAVSRSRTVGGYTMLRAENPVFLISGAQK